jgi:hypothetical protein
MFSYARLTVNSGFLIDYPRVPDNNRIELQEMIIAKEERSCFDVGVTYTFHPNTVVKPFLEFGVQFNYIRVKSFEVVIEETSYNLLTESHSPYIPGGQTTPDYKNWGAPGFGFSLVAGIKLAFSKSVSVDPLFYVSTASMGHSSNLQGYDTSFGFNYAVMIRLIINDSIFRNK